MKRQNFLLRESRAWDLPEKSMLGEDSMIDGEVLQ